MSVYSKFLHLSNGSARTVDLSQNTLGLLGMQLNGSTSGAVTLSAAAITTPYSLTMPADQGAATTALVNDGSGSLSWTSISSVPTIANTFVAGESFAANTSYIVRWGMNSLAELTTRIYKADDDTSSFDEFWAIGVAHSTSAVSAGQSIVVTAIGAVTIGSNNTPFNTADVGQIVWLTASGGFAASIPSGPNLADFKVGTVMSTTQFWLDGQMMGIGTTGGSVSLPLPINEGGTGENTASAAFNALSPITSVGDLIVGTGVNTAGRLAIGANTYVLTSNGTTATWAASAGGGGSSLDGTFRIQNTSDNTKQIAFSASAITTGTTRTITMPDSNVDLGNLTNSNISASAAIAFSKLATLTSGHLLVGSAGGVSTSVAMSGEASIVASGAVTLDNDSVIGKTLTTFTSGAGTVTSSDSILTGLEKAVGNAAAAQSTANAALPSSSFTDTAVTGKVLTGFSAGGSYSAIVATDTILQAFDKAQGNDAVIKTIADAALPSSSFTASSVTSKLIAGFSSGSGSVSASDSILQAINKLDGNDALKLPLAGGTMSGSIAMATNKLTGLGAGTTAGDSVRYEQAILTSGNNSFAADQSMGSHKLTNLADGTSTNDAVNYGQLQSVTNGNVWKDAILDPDMLGDNRTSPPVSPIPDTVYLAAATSGAWTAGHVYKYVASTWVDILGREIATGDRFGITLEDGNGSEDGSFVGKHGYLAQLDTYTPGSHIYSWIFFSPTKYDTVLCNNTLSQHFGHSYNYNGTSWVEVAGPGTIQAGSALSYSGSTLNVGYDNITIDLTSNQLEVKAGGISNSHISTGAAIAYSKLNLTGAILNADLAGSIADSKLSTISTANKVSGSAIQVNSSGAITDSTGLMVNVDNSSIEISTNALRVKVGGITNAMLANSAVTNLSGTNTGDISLGTVGSSPSANGASLSSQVLTLQPFDSTHPGVVTASGGGTSNFLRADGSWSPAGTGTVTAVSVASSNGFAGSSSGGATPALTISTTVSGMLKGNGTAISSATSGTDYSAGTSALGTGILKSTTTTGALTIAIAADFPTLNQNTSGTSASFTGSLTGDVTSTAMATTIAANAVTNAKSAQMAANTIKGNNTGSTANAADLTVAQALTMLGIRAGKTSISSGASTVSVTFSTAFASTGYAVTAVLLNTTDSNPAFQEPVITAQSTTGFTISFNEVMLTANYSLSWTAILSN